jgi:uncharacterized protein (TIRG00374 family)
MLRRLLFGILFGVLVYLGMALWVDLRGIGSSLREMPLWVLPAAAGLSFLNYVIRFAKWQRYLALLEIRLDTRTSFLIYLSGMALSVTPGKMGEVFKSWLIRKINGTRIHRSAPIVVAERFTDLLGYLVLVAVGGIATMPEYAPVFWATLVMCAAGLLLAGSQRFSRFTAGLFKRLPLLWRLAPRIEGSFASTRVLLAPGEILVPTLLSVAGWGCECVGFHLIANALIHDVNARVPLAHATFAYAFSAVAGAVLIIFPGGLGVTEGSMGTLLRREYSAFGLTLEVARSKAAAAVILARVCTLWFAVGLGCIATALFTRRFGRIDDSELTSPEGGLGEEPKGDEEEGDERERRG